MSFFGHKRVVRFVNLPKQDLLIGLAYFLIPSFTLLSFRLAVWGPLTASRLLIVTTFIFAFWAGKFQRPKTFLQVVTVTLSSIWMIEIIYFTVVGGISESGLKEIAAITIGVIVLVTVTSLKNPENLLRFYSYGILLAFVLSAGLGATEWVTGFTTSVPTEALPPGRTSVDYFGLMSMHGNSNNFAFFLLAATPVLYLGLARARSRTMTFLYGLALLWATLLVIPTESRLVSLILIIVLMILFGTSLLLPTLKKTIIGLVVVSSMISSLVTFEFLKGVTPIFISLLSVASSPPSTSAQLDPTSTIETDASTNVRLYLIKSGIQFFVNSFPLGGGPASFQLNMQRLNEINGKTVTLNAHSGLIEVLSQYGLFILIFCALVFVAMLKVLLSPTAKTSFTEEIRIRKVLLIVVLITLVSGTSVFSSTLGSNEYWLTLAFALLIARTIEENNFQDSTALIPLKLA